MGVLNNEMGVLTINKGNHRLEEWGIDMNKPNETNDDCPEHGDTEWAKERFWRNPLTCQWACRCPDKPIGK